MIKILREYEEDGKIITEYTKDGETVSHKIEKDIPKISTPEPVQIQPTNLEIMEQLEIVKQGMIDTYIAVYETAGV